MSIDLLSEKIDGRVSAAWTTFDDQRPESYLSLFATSVVRVSAASSAMMAAVSISRAWTVIDRSLPSSSSISLVEAIMKTAVV